MKKFWLVFIMAIVLLGASSCKAEPDHAEESTSADSVSEQDVSVEESSNLEEEVSAFSSEEDIPEVVPVEESVAPPAAAPEPPPVQEPTYAEGGYPIGDTGVIIPHPNGVLPVDGQITEYNGVEYIFYDLDKCWVENVGGANPIYFDNE